jgi:hypothetical protein
VDNSLPEASPASAADLAAWLRLLQERAGISTRKLASELETDRTNVYRWLGINGRKPTEPGGVWLLRILAVLGARIEPAPPESLAEPPLRESIAALGELIVRQSKLIEDLDVSLRGSEPRLPREESQ